MKRPLNKAGRYEALKRARWMSKADGTRGIGRKGTPHRRVVVDFDIGGYNYAFHATKGWRITRAR